MSDKSWTTADEVIEKLEPHEYFKELKSKLTVVEMESLETQLQEIAEQLISAREIGLKRASHKLAFLYQVILKEQILVTKGYTSFVYLEDVAKWIDTVNPKNSIKICELDRYPRLIPSDSAKKIKEVSDLNIFDLICIIYTDYTEQDINTTAEKEMVQRNRDPIAVGMFHSDIMNFKHDRLYFITDWEDEYCDLTFVRMIERMTETGIKNPEKKLNYDFNYVNQLVEEALGEVKKESNNINNVSTASNLAIDYPNVPDVTKDSLLKKVTKFFKSFKK